ncbi:MAG: DUF3108 domain-containing protein [Bacteroidales bacterium]|nr:DUF3108 domain-containing protein [Bacteroidales bacterium]
MRTVKLLTILLAVWCGAYSLQAQVTVIDPLTVYPMIERPNAQPGEKLTFNIRFGIINGGQAFIELKSDTLGNRRLWHSTLIGRTSGMVDKFFKVYDIYESWFDSTTIVPVKAIRNIQEGRYRYYDQISYHPGQPYVSSEKHGQVTVPEKVLDMACVLYYARMVSFDKLQKDDMINIDTYFGGDYFPFQLIYRGKEVVKTSMGTFSCLRIGPVVEPGRVFAKNDDMMLWLTDDENRLPVRIQFDVWAGSFKCDLIAAENVKFPLKSKIK